MRPSPARATQRAGRVGRAGRWLGRILGLVAFTSLTLGAAVAPAPIRIGLRATFEQMLDRQKARAEGRAVTFGLNPNTPSPFRLTDEPQRVPTTVYSPWLDTVFEISGPGWVPREPEYYVVDGAYLTYDPPNFQDPSVRVRAFGRATAERTQLDAAEHALYTSRQAAAFAGEHKGLFNAGSGVSVTVPIRMPGVLSEFFGRGATNIKVTGRENISFAGESRTVSPFLAGEQGRGQSIFPRLDMKQELQVKLDGTIGDKVHVQVDHNSAGFGADANRINIYYEGYDDDILRRIDLGGTNLSLPGSNLVSFSGGHQGLFGIKTTMRLGGLDLTMIASKEEADVETRTVTPSGGAARPVQIEERSFLRDQFFFYSRPDTTGETFEGTYGIDPDSLFLDSTAPNIRVFVDTQDPTTQPQRNYRGFAVADLATSNETQMVDAYNNANSNSRFPVPGAAGTVPGDNGYWKEIDHDDLGFVVLTLGNTRKILGFYFRTGRVRDRDAVGVVVTGPNARWGSVTDDPQTRVRLRLLRHPEQDASFSTYPSAAYMMRHVYYLGSAGITNLDLRVVSNNPARQPPDVPILLQNSTYLHMFGLDEFGDQNSVGPDGKFDLTDINRLDRDSGFLFMPGIRPFSPPESVLRRRVGTIPQIGNRANAPIDSLFSQEERISPTLYTLKDDDRNLPRLNYHFDVVITGTETEITLPQDIIEGSEVVKLDGRTLTRGIDYDIENFAGGKITLKGDALASVSPTSRIEVAYQFRPLFGGGKSTLLGVSGEYQLGNRGKLASVLLYESTGGFTRRPKLGEEPTRAVVGDLNGTMRFQPNWLTKLVNALPFTNATAASALNVAAEIATSVPNPNTRKEAFVDDLEGADDSDDQNLSRTNWSWASIPIDDRTGTKTRADTLLRLPVAFYNPPTRVKRSHLIPNLNEREGNDGLTVLEVGFDRAKLAALQDSLPIAKRDSLWSGIMHSFGATPIDMTRTKSIELWLNDGERAAAGRTGRMHIDFGKLSEDFVFFPETQFANAPSHFNREAEAGHFTVSENDFGWDHQDRGCSGLKDSEAEDLPFGSECYRPSVLNRVTQQFFLANGSEGNQTYDTEDLNNNGQFDDTSSYFSLSLDLSDPTFVVADGPVITGHPEIAWRKYRLDLDRVVPQVFRDVAETDPNLRRISYIRIWFEDTPGTPAAQSVFNRNIEIFGLRLTKNQWFDLGFFGVDSTKVVPQTAESFTIGVINNKDDANYELPPASIELDETGVQSRQQSLRIGYNNLAPGHEVVAERSLGGGAQGTDFTLYKRLTYFVHAPPIAPTDSGATEFFFRVGTDTLNYYEVATPGAVHPGWLHVSVDLEQLTGLKFPEDYPGARDTILAFGAQRIIQVSALTKEKKFGNDVRVTVRGSPSFQRVLRLFVGVRNRGTPNLVEGVVPGGPRATGEYWFDNVRLEEVEKTPGYAQSYSLGLKISDLFDISGGYRKTDGEFRPLRQRTGSNRDDQGWNARLSVADLSRLVPTLGFSIPVGYGYEWNRSLPKFFEQSDTRNTPERKLDQRNENVRKSYNFGVSKKPSHFWLSKFTLDRLQYSFGSGRTEARTFTARDTSTTRTQNLAYDLPLRERPLALWGKTRLNLVPTNLKFSLQSNAGDAVSYRVRRVAGVDSLARQVTSPSHSINVNASTAFHPVPDFTLRYSFQEPRGFRLAHPDNERERIKFLGYDFGLPVGSRIEGYSAEWSPGGLTLGGSTNFGDSRVQQVDASPQHVALPDLHNAKVDRSAHVSFVFGFHRWVFGHLRALAPVKKPAGPPQTNGSPPPIDGNRQPGGADGSRTPAGGDNNQEDPTTPLEIDAPDSLRTSQGFAPPAPRSPADTLVGRTPALPIAGAQPVPGGIAAKDSTHTRTRPKAPSPVDLMRGILNVMAGIEPVKVDYQVGQGVGYVGLPDAPTGAFRYLLAKRSGLLGTARFETPPAESNNNNLDLSTAIPLRGALRMAARYKRRASVGQSRTFAVPTGRTVETLTNTNEDHRIETTFPSLDLTINDVQKLRLFTKRLERSTLSLNFARTTNKSFRLDQAPGRAAVEGSGRNQTDGTTMTASWTGQWRGGMSSTMSLNQTNNTVLAPGTRSEGVTRQVQAGVRFKLAPKGGLRLPFMHGSLKSGMDVSVNGTFNTDDRQRLNSGSQPIIEANGSSLNIGTRGDYTLSRNMNGGVEVGYTRTSRDDIQKQTVNTVRLGFNLTFLF